MKTVVLSQKATFRKELRPLTRITIRTTCAGFDRISFVMKQEIHSKVGCHAIVYVRVCGRKDGKFVSPKVLFKRLGVELDKIPADSHVKAWLEAEREVLDLIRHQGAH